MHSSIHMDEIVQELELQNYQVLRIIIVINLWTKSRFQCFTSKSNWGSNKEIYKVIRLAVWM